MSSLWVYATGAQMLAQLRELIPGTQNWPRFTHNASGQFEARLVMVEIMQSPSIFFQDMHGSCLPIAVAHAEGKADFLAGALDALLQSRLVPMRYINNSLQATDKYPYNPNGSPFGVTGFCNQDGRFTIMMPHPERLFRSVQYSWHPGRVVGRRTLDADIQECTHCLAVSCRDWGAATR